MPSWSGQNVGSVCVNLTYQCYVSLSISKDAPCVINLTHKVYIFNYNKHNLQLQDFFSYHSQK